MLASLLLLLIWFNDELKLLLDEIVIELSYLHIFFLFIYAFLYFLFKFFVLNLSITSVFLSFLLRRLFNVI